MGLDQVTSRVINRTETRRKLQQHIDDLKIKIQSASFQFKMQGERGIATFQLEDQFEEMPVKQQKGLLARLTAIGAGSKKQDSRVTQAEAAAAARNTKKY